MKMSKLLALALVLLISVGTLAGSTIAWFTDSVTSANNVIKSGELKLGVFYKDANGSWIDLEAADAEPLFSHDNWEPGYTTYKFVKLENKGSLAFEYKLNVKATAPAEGDYNLADVIDVYMLPVNPEPTRDSFKNMKPVGTLSELMADANGAAYGVLLPSTSSDTNLPKEISIGSTEVCIGLKMQESAGNEYQGLSVGDGFALEVLAKQYTYEEDSFGKDYDDEADYNPGVFVGPDGTDLMALLANAEKDQPLKITLMDDAVYKTEGHHGENDITPASEVIIDGQGHNLFVIGAGVTPIGDSEAPLTLKNLKVVDQSVSYKEGSWEFGYLEMGGKNLTCENVTFRDPIMVEADDAAFTGCTFTGKTTAGLTAYGVWEINGDATFEDCKFIGTRGLKICDMYNNNEVGAVVVDGCEFINLSQKPGVAIDDEGQTPMNITIKNSIFTNCQPGDAVNGDQYGVMYVYETNDTKPTLEKNTVTNNSNPTISVDNAEDLYNLTASGINGNTTINVTKDMTTFDQGAVHCYTGKSGNLTINGNGNTITSTASSIDVFTWDGTKMYDEKQVLTNIPAMSTIFSSEDGSKVTVNDLSFSGTMSAVMLGHYVDSKSNWYNTELNNVNVIGAEVVSFSGGISPAVCAYGTAVLNNCNIYGTTLSELDTDPMWPVYDLAAVNYTDVTVNNSKIGSIYAWPQAKVTVGNGSEVDSIVVAGNMNTTKYGVTIKSDATVGSIDLTKITDKNRVNFTIEDGATVGKIVANGVEYASIADWQNA